MNRQQRRLLAKAKGDPERAREIATSRAMRGEGSVTDRVALAQAMDDVEGSDDADE